jgi:hypothetical protein
LKGERRCGTLGHEYAAGFDCGSGADGDDGGD